MVNRTADSFTRPIRFGTLPLIFLKLCNQNLMVTTVATMLPDGQASASFSLEVFSRVISGERTEMSTHSKGPFELDHATDDGTRHFIVHGELPKGLNASYGYPICDSLIRHHCVPPEEDEANGRLFAASWDMLKALKRVIDSPWEPDKWRREVVLAISKAESE